MLYRLAQCLVAAGRPAEALPHLEHLRETYPTSAWLDDAAKLVTQIAEAHAAPVPPGASPAPVEPPAASPAPSASPSPEAPAIAVP